MKLSIMFPMAIGSLIGGLICLSITGWRCALSGVAIALTLNALIVWLLP